MAKSSYYSRVFININKFEKGVIKMKMPGFIAEASIYKTKGNYHGSGIGTTSSSQIIPQGCDFFKSARCAAQVGACVATCSADWSTIACLACIGGLGDCRDCL